MTSGIAALKEKQTIYELFAAIFAKEPTVEFLNLLQEPGNEEILKSYGIDCLSDIKDFPPGKQREMLAVEYARLFLMPGQSISPHESIQRGEGRFWGEATVKVSEIYKKFGFELDDGFGDAPDHISAELSFLAQLSRLEADYAGQSKEEARKGVLKVKKYFLKNHLFEWFFAFKSSIIKTAEFAYYRKAVELLEVLLNKEWESLRDSGEVISDV